MLFSILLIFLIFIFKVANAVPIEFLPYVTTKSQNSELQGGNEINEISTEIGELGERKSVKRDAEGVPKIM